MKGIVFTEFIEMMEGEIGIARTQELLNSLELTDGGAFTSIGDYPFSDLVKIVVSLSEMTRRSVPEQLHRFGEYFATSIYRQYRGFFDQSATLFDFLASIHNYIHVEVMKLYPKAQPPGLVVTDRSDSHIKLLYNSHRSLGVFAEGLIRGVSGIYGTPVRIQREEITEDGTEVSFHISLEDVT